MSPGDKPLSGRTPPKKALYEVEITPSELGKKLAKGSDVVILGEIHPSQAVLDMQAEIAKAIKPDVLFDECSASIDLNKEKLEDLKSNWSTSQTARIDAKNNGTKIVSVDVEHYNSKNSITLTAEGSPKQKRGAQMNAVLGDVDQYLAAKGIKDALKPWSGYGSSASGYAEQIISRHGNNLQDFHINLLREAAEDEDRRDYPGLGAKIARAFDRIDDRHRRNQAKENRLQESDPVMAENIDKAMQDMTKSGKHPTGVFTVGMAHNKGVEENLENKGYEVANVKIIPTERREMHGKVFRNPQSNGREDGEWFVPVYDNKYGALFDREYSFRTLKQEDRKGKYEVPQDAPEEDKSGANNEISDDMRRAMQQFDQWKAATSPDLQDGVSPVALARNGQSSGISLG